MANRIQHRVAVRFKNNLLEFAAAPPLVLLGKHVFHDVFGRHMFVALDIELGHLDLAALAHNEGHFVLVVFFRSFTVADFGQQITFGMEIVQQGLTVAFQLALAIHLPRNNAKFQTQIFFGNFIAAIKIGRIQRREFLDLEDNIHIRAFVHIINPGSHIVKKARIVKIGHRRLDFLR